MTGRWKTRRVTSNTTSTLPPPAEATAIVSPDGRAVAGHAREEQVSGPGELGAVGAVEFLGVGRLAGHGEVLRGAAGSADSRLWQDWLAARIRTLPLLATHPRITPFEPTNRPVAA
jgi:hypothetical protein